MSLTTRKTPLVTMVSSDVKPTPELKKTITLSTTTTPEPDSELKLKTKILFNLANLKEYVNFSVLERRIDLPNGTLIRFLEGKSNRVKPIHLIELRKQTTIIMDLLTDLNNNTTTYEQLSLFNEAAL